MCASLMQSVDGGTNLESETQLDIHGGDEVILVLFPVTEGLQPALQRENKTWSF